MSGRGKKRSAEKAKAKGRARKILRDNIGGISRPAMRRLMEAAGATRISGLMYEVIRSHLSELIRILMKHLATLAVYLKKKTITLDMVKYIVPDIHLSNTYYNARMPFERLIREIMQDYQNDIRFSKEALNAIQNHVENYIIALGKAAVLKKGKRITIFPKDMDAVYKDELAKWNRFETGKGFTFTE